MAIVSSNTTTDGYTTTEGYTSTLLIPEETACLPYVGLVLTVVIWLGYDFYRFHEKNKQKYARAEEHLTILRAVPSHHRISMVSGIGLRFRRGKPILGDVWNTSPSSSDMSTCYVPRRRHALVSYSREVTPSDEEGKYSENDVFEDSKTGSCADLVGHEVHNTHHKTLEIGGEFVKGRSNKRSSNEDRDPFYSETRDSNSHRTVVSSSRASLSSGTTTTTETFYTGDHQHSPWASASAASGGVGVGVYHGGGGMSRYSRRDIATQTNFDDFMTNATSNYMDISNTDNPYFYTAQPPYSATTLPRLHRSSEGTESVSPRWYSGGTPEHSAPATAPISTSRSSSDARPMDIPHNSTLPKSSGGKSERRHPPPLRLGLISAPYSPTSEIVATKHGFAIEGLEVPHFSNSGGRALPSTDDAFKSPNSRSSNHSSSKPLSPSPAVSSRMSSSHPISPRESSDHHTSSQRSHHRHRQKRQDTLSVASSGHSSSKVTSNSKKNSHALPPSSRHPRAVSSSPRMLKENEEAMSLKTFKDSSSEGPKTAPIPSHMYHEDEEGFFSSVTSASHTRRYNRETEDYSNKGILFFSRLAGIGRHQDPGMMGGGGRQVSGAYKSGGFES